MAFNAGQLNAVLSVSTQQFMQGLAQARAALNTVGRTMGSNFQRGTSNIRGTNSAAQQLNNTFKNMDRIVSGIIMSQAFYRATNAIQDGTAAIMRFSNNMQDAQVSMEYFLGNKEDAAGFLEVMKDFAATTPFATEQALKLARSLMAGGQKPENVKGIMQILTDAASATGGTADQMDRIVLAMTQMKTNGYIAGQELRQLAEANIPIYKILAEELGLTSKQLSQIGDLKISGDLGVAAVLKGLEKRYKGATDRINDNISGMWSTIKDDTLILSDAIFKGPYNAIGRVLRTLRDGMEKARDIVTKSGVGGLFEKLVPPELQTSVRAVMASMKSLLQSLLQVGAILGKSLIPVFGLIVKTLGTVLPTIAAVVSWTVRLIQATLQAAPALNLLVGAFTALLIGGTVARVLMFLWSVMRVGMICSVVAQAVTILATSIRVLFLAAVSNPITGIIMLIAAAVMYLAVASGTLSRWLDTVTGKLASLAGMNLGDIFSPEDKKSLDEWQDKFGKNIDLINQNLQDTGKNAQNAGKKVKDGFVASFDEVFQVPKELDDVASNLDNIGNIPKFDTKMPDFGKGKDKSDNPFDNNWPPIFPPGPGPKTPSPKPPSEPPEIPPPNTGAVTAAITTINQLLAAARANVAAWATEVGAALNGLVGQLAPAVVGVGAFVTSFNMAFQGVPQAVQAALAPIPGIVSLMVTTITGIIAQGIPGFTTPWNEGWMGMPIPVTTALAAILAAVQAFGPQLVTAWTASWAGMLTPVQVFVTGTLALLNGFITSMSGLFTPVTTFFTSMWQGITQATSTALNWIKSMWDQHKVAILVTVAAIVVAIVSIFTLGLPEIIAGLGVILAGIAEWLVSVGGLFLRLGPLLMTALRALPALFRTGLAALEPIAEAVVARIATFFTGLGPRVMAALTSLGSSVTGLFSGILSTITTRFQSFFGWIGTAVSNIANTVGNLLAKIGGKMPSMPSLNPPTVPGFATGGIISKESFIKISEGNKREAVVPLENPSAMQPFADAVAAGVASVLGTAGGGGQSSQQPPQILYVGNLIADERGLRELERKMQVIRLQEKGRGAGG